MGLAHELGKTIGRALAPVRAGEDGLASRVLAVLDRRTLSVTSSAFTDGGSLPRSLARSLVHRRQRGPRLPSPRVEQRPRGHALDGGHRRGRRRAHAQALRPLARLRHPTSVGSVQGAQRLEGKNSKLGVGFTPAARPSATACTTTTSRSSPSTPRSISSAAPAAARSSRKCATTSSPGATSSPPTSAASRSSARAPPRLDDSRGAAARNLAPSTASPSSVAVRGRRRGAGLLRPRGSSSNVSPQRYGSGTAWGPAGERGPQERVHSHHRLSPDLERGGGARVPLCAQRDSVPRPEEARSPPQPPKTAQRPPQGSRAQRPPSDRYVRPTG